FVIVSSLVVLVFSGCAPAKPARMILPFATPTAGKPVAVIIDDPPPLRNLYLNSETPSPVSENYRVLNLPTASDLLMTRADDAYQRGKRYYQAGDKERARIQFDRAVELLFQASENPTDRT